MNIRLVFVSLCGVMCGCSQLPAPYAPPPQRPFFVAAEGAPPMINMADADAEEHFVQDIGPDLEGNTWRWVGKRPTVRVHTISAQKLAYVIDFVIAGQALEHTGPVTLTFYMDHHVLGQAHYTESGRHLLEEPIPAEWMHGDSDVLLSAEIDKVWVQQPNSMPLGFLLVSMGLKQK